MFKNIMDSNEVYSIREWAPLNLNERIPASIQRGLFSVEITFTCVDAIPDHLAIGTNVGIVFWYNRHGEMQKLRAEVASRITCVKIVDSVEYMVAAGCANGQVSVFRIQKPLPPDLNLVAPCARLKPIERYTIRDLHHTPVTCCEWSKNGMKLYSGDRQGIVVLTELDYQAHLSKSIEILSEAYEIVQLSVHQCYLLVSTLYRAIICQRNITTGQWHITQVGKKDRKQLVDCGGIFIKRDAKQPLLVLGRPGLRFWFANTEGNVEKTLIFRDAIMHSSAWEIPILNPRMTSVPVQNNMSSSNINEAQNFRTFQLYTATDALILTHDEASLYLLNIDRLRVEAVARGFRKILDFCVCGNEIFVLEGDRSIIRLAPAPEKPNKSAQIIFNPSLPPPVPVLGAAAAGLFESPVEYEPEEQKIINAEECFELPPIETLNLNIPIELAVESPRAEQNRRLQIFNEISQMDFDQSILHRSGLLINGRKKRKSKSSERHTEPATGIVEIGQVAKTSEDKEVVAKPERGENVLMSAEQTSLPTLMDASYCNSTIEDKSIEKPKELTLELNGIHENLLAQTHVSPISPIAAEEFERAQCLAASAMLTQNATTSTVQPKEIKSPILQLEYPKLSQVTRKENVEIQTMPCDKSAYLEEKDGLRDYSAGQPVDDICQALHATVLIEDTQNNSSIQNVNESIPHTQQQPIQLHFVTSPPAAEDINSFLPDFRRIRDPLYRSPPPSGDSGTSSEWEFLDN